MSYDLYCYKATVNKPDLEDAQAAIEIDEDGTIADPQLKEKIAKALLDYNPQLERFEFDHGEMAEHAGEAVDEGNKAFTHIELNTPESGLATQITIFNTTVSITVPYWYSGQDADKVFDNIAEYAKVIRRAAGYFVYDPQTDAVFDPLTESNFGVDLYKSMTVKVENLVNRKAEEAVKKPWWRFW